MLFSLNLRRTSTICATNDIFISARYDDVNMSKSQLIDFYIANMVGSTGGGSESGITSGDVESMIEASLQDYYDIDEIDAAFSAASEFKGKPSVIVANSVKGKGVSFMEDQVSWHGAAPNKEQFEQAISELDEALSALETE